LLFYTSKSEGVMTMLELLEWVAIPEGRVLLEVEDVTGNFPIKPFKICRFPVTNAQYDAFIADYGYKNPRWWDGLELQIKSARVSDWKEAYAPKLEVSWFEAVAYSRWLSDTLGMNVRLPTEWEWQWAAVGDSGWDYPYGASFDSSKSNTKESSMGRTNMVEDFAHIETVFGAVDMSGNVLEWCLNKAIEPLSTRLSGGENRVLKGGSWNNTQEAARASSRVSRTPMTRAFNVGFRLIIEEE
jgi:formylglycine-generating enzyme required for sulfatase activity